MGEYEIGKGDSVGTKLGRAVVGAKLGEAKVGAYVGAYIGVPAPVTVCICWRHSEP